MEIHEFFQFLFQELLIRLISIHVRNVNNYRRSDNNLLFRKNTKQIVQKGHFN